MTSAVTTERLTRQIHWARAEAERLRRIARRNQASPRAALHARRMAVLAEATVTTLTELATLPAPAAYPNRLNLWMAAPAPAERESEARA